MSMPPPSICPADASGVARDDRITVRLGDIYEDLLCNVLGGRFIASEACKRVGLLTGAGVSVAAGIPDFRSPGGMYATLRADRLTCSEQERKLLQRDPQMVVDKRMFSNNPFPYLEVRRPFILGTIRDKKWKPTIAHWFARLLHDHQKLSTVYTQNIDGLDYHVGIPLSSIVPVHGSIGRVACEACGSVQDEKKFCQEVQEKIKDIYETDPSAPSTSTHILCKCCGKPQVKPTTVLFGGSLPSEFFKRAESELPTLDLLIVAGTSLQVSPANGVATSVTCPRVLINRELVGQDLGINFRSHQKEEGGVKDLHLEGDCDVVFESIIEELGWKEELETLRSKSW